MKCSRLLYIIIAFNVGLFVLGCSGRPVEQIDRTEKARQQAKDEHADQFAPDEWKIAETAWSEAQAKLEQQKWGEASNQLLRAASNYVKARDIAQGQRQAAIQEIENTRKTIEIRTKALKDEIAANAKKLNPARTKSLEELLKGIDEKAAKIGSQLQQGLYSDAKYLAGTTLREVWDTRKEFEGYIGKK
jgi:hypothetical protein